YLHSQSPYPLLHLDLKPENIFLIRDYRGYPLPVLLDFGISRFANADESGEVSVRGTFPMWPRTYMESMLRRMTNAGRAIFVINRKTMNTDLDLHLLGRTISMAVLSGVKQDPQTPMWSSVADSTYKFLTETLERLDIDRPEAPKFET